MIHLNKIGLEIEGEWSGELLDFIESHPAVNELKRDGSISRCSYSKHDEMRCAELTTIPLELGNVEHMQALAGLFGLLADAYDAGTWHYNSTCGFHVHTSYREGGSIIDVLPDTIANSSFYSSFLDAVKARYPKVYEAREYNRYCMTQSQYGNDDAGAQFDKGAIATYSGDTIDRYRAVNLASYRKYGTVEFRFFPARKPLVMKEYLEFIIAHVNKALASDTLTARMDAEIPLEQMESVTESTEKHIESIGTPIVLARDFEVYPHHARAKARRLSIGVWRASANERSINIEQ